MEVSELINFILIRFMTKVRVEDVCQVSQLPVGDRNCSGGTRDECFYITGMDIGVVFDVSSIRTWEELYCYAVD